MKIKSPAWTSFILLTMSLAFYSCIPTHPSPPCFDGDIEGDDTWSDIYVGSDTTVPYLPDIYSNYWASGFNLSSTTDVGFRIHGEYSFARYMSFNIYDGTIGTALSGILDRDIQPNCISENPYDGGEELAADRSYLVHLLPQGTDADDLVNPVFYDPELDNITVLLRYYVPEGDQQASVPLPTVEAFDTESGNSISLPPDFSSNPPDPATFEDRLEAFFATQIDNKVRFYNINSAGLFANIDNKYLATAIDRSEGEVLAIRFRPPTFAATKEEIPGAQVRYWSLNLSETNTFTYAGIRDEEAVGNQNDWVYFLIGDAGDTDLMAVAAESGYNYIPWNVTGNKGILVYRNLVTRNHFDGNIDRVPLLDGGNQINVFLQESRNFIGSYAPRGFRLSRSEFMSNPVGVF